MELYQPRQHSSAWPFFLLAPYYSAAGAAAGATPHNYVHWTETPDSHLFSADLPGVRKEEIRVEVEDSLYLVIRTEFGQGGADDDEESAAERERKRSFLRKFRLPRLVDLEGIAAVYEHGVLTVTVPRSASRRRLGLAPEDVADARSSVARAA